MFAGLIKTTEGVKTIPDLVPIGRRVLVDNPLGLSEKETVENIHIIVTPIASTLVVDTNEKVYVEVFAPNPTQMLLLAKEGELTPPFKAYKVKKEALPALIDYIKGLKEGYVLPLDALNDYLIEAGGAAKQTIFALGVNAKFASANAWKDLERFYLLERGFFRIKRAAESQNGFISLTEDGSVKGEIAQTLVFRLSNGVDAKLMAFVVPKSDNLYPLLEEKAAVSWEKKNEIIARSISPFALDLEVKYRLSDKVAVIPEEAQKTGRTFKGFRRVVKIKLPLTSPPQSVLDEVSLVNFLLDAGDADSPLTVSLPKLEALAKEQKVITLIYHNPSPVLYYLKMFYHIDLIIAFLNAVNQFLYEALGEEAYYPSYSKLADKTAKEAERFERLRLKLIKALAEEFNLKPEYLENLFNVVAFSNLTTAALKALEKKILDAAEKGGSEVTSVVQRIKNAFAGLVDVAFEPLYRVMGLEGKPSQELDKIEGTFEKALEALYEAVEAGTSRNKKAIELAQYLADFYIREKGDRKLAEVLKEKLGISQAYFTLIDFPGLRETIAAITNIEREVGTREIKEALQKVFKGRYSNIAVLMATAPRAKRLFKEPDEGETYSLSQFLFNIAYKAVKNRLSASKSRVSRHESVIKVREEEVKPEQKEAKAEQKEAKRVIIQTPDEIKELEEESGIDEERLKDMLELAEIPVEEESYTDLDELTEAALQNIYHSTEEIPPERRYRYTKGSSSLYHLEKFYRAEGIPLGGGREARFQPILDIFTALEAVKRAIEETTWEEFKKAPYELDYNEITTALFDKVIQKLESKGVSPEIRDFFEGFVYNIILEVLTYVSTFVYKVGIVKEEKLTLKERAELFYSFVELLFAFLEDIKQWIAIVVVNPTKLNTLFEVREEFKNLKPFTPRWLSVLKKLTQSQIKVKKDFTSILRLVNGKGQTSLRTRVLKNLAKVFEEQGAPQNFTARIPHISAIVIELLTIFGHLAENKKAKEFVTEENFVKLAKAFAVMIANSALGLDRKRGKKAELLEKLEQGYKVPDVPADILTGRAIERRLFALLRDIAEGASIKQVLAEFKNIWEKIEALSILYDNDNLYIRTFIEVDNKKEEIIFPYKLVFVTSEEERQKGIGALPGTKILDPGILAARKIISGEFTHLAEFYKAYFKTGNILLSTRIPTQELLLKYPEIRDYFEEFLKREIAAAVQRSLFDLANYYMINNALESAGRPTALLILKKIFFDKERKAVDVFFDFLNAVGITANTYFAKNSVIAARLPVKLKLLDSGKAANLGLPITKSYLLAQWESVAESMPYYNVPIYGVPSWAFMVAHAVVRPIDLLNEKTVGGGDRYRVERLLSTLAASGVPSSALEKAYKTKGWLELAKSLRNTTGSSSAAFFALKTAIDTINVLEEVENKTVSSFVRTYNATITEVQGRYAFSLVEDIPTLALQVPQILNKAGIDIYLNNLLQSIRSFLILESLMASYFQPDKRKELERGKSFRAYISSLLKEAFVGKGLKDLSVPEIIGQIYDAYRELLFNEQPTGKPVELNADEVITAFEDFRDIVQRTSYFNALLVMAMMDMLAYLGEAPKSPAEAFAKLSAASSYLTVLNAVQTAYKFLKEKNPAWATITDDPVYGVFALIDTYKELLAEYRKRVLSPKAISSPQSLATEFQKFKNEHLKSLVLKFVSKKFLKGLSILKLLTHTLAFEPIVIERVFPKGSYPYSTVSGKDKYERSIIAFLTAYATDYMANFLYIFKGRIGTPQGSQIVEKLAKAGSKSFYSAKGTFGFYAKFSQELRLKSITPDVRKYRDALLYTMAAVNASIVNPLNEALESLGGGAHTTLMGQIITSVYDEVRFSIKDTLKKDDLERFYSQILPTILSRAFNKVIQKIGASGLFIVDVFKALGDSLEEFINWIKLAVTPLTTIYAEKIPGEKLAEAVSAGVGNLLHNKLKIANLSLKTLALRSLTAYYASAVKALYDSRLNKEEIALMQVLVAFLFLYDEAEHFMALEKQFAGTFVEEAFKRAKIHAQAKSSFVLVPEVLAHVISMVLNNEVEGVPAQRLEELILLFIALFVEGNFIPAHVATKLNVELLKWFPEFMNAGVLASPIAFFVGRRTIQRFGLYLGKAAEEAKETIAKFYEERDLKKMEKLYRELGEIKVSPEDLMNYAIIAPHRL